MSLKGDITDLAVSSNNAVVASGSNDFVIRVVCYHHSTKLLSMFRILRPLNCLSPLAVALNRWNASLSFAGTHRSCYCYCIQSQA